MIELSPNWAKMLAKNPETGMGFQIVTIVLKDGSQFDQVAVVEGCITQIRGRNDIPFTEDEIQRIIVTHDKWDFIHERKGGL